MLTRRVTFERIVIYQRCQIDEYLMLKIVFKAFLRNNLLLLSFNLLWTRKGPLPSVTQTHFQRRSEVSVHGKV